MTIAAHPAPQTFSKAGLITLISSQLPPAHAKDHENLEQMIRIQFARIPSERLSTRDLKYVIGQVNDYVQRTRNVGYDTDTRDAATAMANAFVAAVGILQKNPLAAEPNGVVIKPLPAKPSLPHHLTGRTTSAATPARAAHAQKAAQMLSTGAVKAPAPSVAEPVTEKAPPAPIAAPLPKPAAVARIKPAKPVKPAINIIAQARPAGAITHDYKTAWTEVGALAEQHGVRYLTTLTGVDSPTPWLRLNPERFAESMTGLRASAKEHGLLNALREPLARIETLHAEYTAAKQHAATDRTMQR